MKCPVCGKPRTPAGKSCGIDHSQCMKQQAEEKKAAEAKRLQAGKKRARRYVKGVLPNWMLS